MRRALTASILFLAVVAGWVAPRVLTYVCSMDGRARSECCCAPHSDSASAEPHAAFERTGCCEVRSERATVAVSTAPAPERAIVHGVAIVGASPSWSVREPVFDLVLGAPRGPPRAIGPPPYLRHRVLLI